MVFLINNRPLLRSTEELSELLHLAKLDESNLCNVTQIIYAQKANDFSNKKLIELDKSLLEAVQVGDRYDFFLLQLIFIIEVHNNHI